MTHVYTDGACSGNPGPGGWAWAVPNGRVASGGDEMTTNQRMELQAVLEAVRAIDGPVTIHSDSTYVVNCFNDRWFDGWLARGWRNSQKKPVANRDLWEPLVDLYLARAEELTFVWVKGHSGDRWNEVVDQMAVAEVAKLKELLSGAGSAGGSADGTVAGPEAPWPMDRAIAVTGVRELDDDQSEALIETVQGLDPAHDILVSGLRRGTELETAEQAIVHGIPLAIVLPYADPAARWPGPLLQRFETCVAKADWTVTLEGDPSKPSTAVGRRDDWVWANVVGVITVGMPELTDRLDEVGLGVIEIP